MDIFNQIEVKDAVSLELLDNYYADYSCALGRFFCLVSMLPDSCSLGMRIDFSNEYKPRVFAFSDSEICIKDYEWMFSPCATVTELSEINNTITNETNVYSIEEDDSSTLPYVFKDKNLLNELAEFKVVIDIITSLKNHNYVSVTLTTTKELPLRTRLNLSNFFQGLKIVKLTESDNKYIPHKLIINNLKSLLIDIGEKYHDLEPLDPILVDDFEEPKISTSIEELDLSVRSYNCLKKAGIYTIDELRKKSSKELIKVRNLGKKHVKEIYEKLEEYDKTQNKEEILISEEKTGQEELDELIGLDKVKSQVKRITAFAKMQKDMRDRGIDVKSICLNMIFTGNPGTAKTTVARIMAKILYDIGLLKTSNLIEVGRADMVGKYEGQTANKVKEVFAKAKGGLLFIDEAYSLLECWDNAYGDEAINALVQEMENNRLDTIVILAGYTDLMEEFLVRNPGLNSRIPFHVEFANYSTEEMVEISKLEARKHGFTISEDAVDIMMDIFAKAQGYTDNGNGRFCRNLIENAILTYAERIYEKALITQENDFTLKGDDFSNVQIKGTGEKACHIIISKPDTDVQTSYKDWS